MVQGPMLLVILAFAIVMIVVLISRFKLHAFLALNGDLREDVDFSGNFVLQTGWQWRGESGQSFRLGVQYFSGNSEQFETFTRYERKVGFGVWYDF